jgi:eukaryotic-like serine/threonine-protein kinase
MDENEGRGGTVPTEPPDVRPVHPDNLPPGTRVGPWIVRELLGVGGYGAVYRVEDTRLEVAGGASGPFALKLSLRGGIGAQRAVRERELLARVRHPNVVRLNEAGQWPETPDGLPFLVMPLVKGVPLYVWARGRALRLVEVVVLFRALAGAVGAVHEVGALHRDVKGENILVGEDGVPVLVDFGAGDYEGAETLTRTPLPPGTWEYRSPEALRFQRSHLDDPNAHYDFGRADELYALGVTFYRLLVDAYPFDSDGPAAFSQARLKGRVPPSPSALNPCVPAELGALVLRMLADRPEQRAASTREVDEALAALRVDAEAWLFEGAERRSTHSRTTEPARLVESGGEAPRSEVAPPVPARPSSASRWLGVLAALGVCMCLLAAVGIRPWKQPVTAEATPSRVEAQVVLAPAPESSDAVRGAAPSGSSSTSAPAAPAAPPEKEKAPVKATRSSRADAPNNPSPRKKPGLVEKCTAAASAGVVLAACAGVPINPRRLECTEEARKTMERLGLFPGTEGILNGHFDQPGYSTVMTTYQEGPIVSGVDEFMEDPDGGDLPEGTLLYGWVWSSGDRVYGRYTRAKFPDGQEIPLCIVLGTRDKTYWPMYEEFKAGPTWEMGKSVPFHMVDRFE